MLNHISANEKCCFKMTLGLRQYMAGYIVSNFLCFPIRHRVTSIHALGSNLAARFHFSESAEKADDKVYILQNFKKILFKRYDIEH